MAKGSTYGFSPSRFSCYVLNRGNPCAFLDTTQTRPRQARPRHGGDPGRASRRPARHPSPRAPTSEPGGRLGAMCVRSPDIHAMQSTNQHTHADTLERATRAPCTRGRTEPQSASCSIAPEPAAAPVPPPVLLALPFPAEPFCLRRGLRVLSTHITRACWMSLLNYG